MSAAEDPTDPIRKLVSREHHIGLDRLALAVDPLGLDRVEPRALLGQKAGYYAHSVATVFDLPVVGGEPFLDELALVPACVVPDQEQSLLAHSFELLAAPPKELRGYGTYRTAVHEPQPTPAQFGQVEPVTRESPRIGVVLFRLLLEKAHRLSGLGPRVQARLLKAAPPGFVLVAQDPLRVAFGKAYQPPEGPFFLSYSGSGLSIHLFARFQRTPSLARVARMVSPLTRLSVRPSSKLTSAASSSVQRLVCLPNSLGERCSNSLRASESPSPKAAWMRFGREEPGTRASRARSLNAWIALRTVWEPHPRLAAILGGDCPRALARSIWERRRTKASLERSPASRAWRSFLESSRTKIGGFMKTTIAHHTQPVLEMH